MKKNENVWVFTWAGVLLALWGLINWDWFKVLIGILMFLGAFIYDTKKSPEDYN